MNANAEYKRWCDYGDLLPEFRAELASMTQQDVKEAFSMQLTFGTAGLRGVMGAGTNRMNVYTVAATTAAIVTFLKRRNGKKVVVCYDCRNHSADFAAVTALIFAQGGLDVMLFDGMRPTPELSFAVRRYGCDFGVNITASHNPKEYNGYKAYGPDGAQINDEDAAEIAQIRDGSDLFAALPNHADLSPEGLRAAGVRFIGAEVDNEFLNCVQSCSILPGAAALVPNMKIVYTPFHGTGRVLVPEILKRIGFTNLYCVAEQMVPDGNFSTVKSPNPENVEGFALAVRKAEEIGSDLIIGTDPDADRIGLAVRNAEGVYVSISGNQLGILLTDFILNAGRESGVLPPKPAVVSTIVSTMMARTIAESCGAVYRDAFTGFRFIAEQIHALEQEGCTTVLGFEESCGYLSGTYACDKDAVVASMLVAELAAWHAAKGDTLCAALEKIYNRYGWYAEKTVNIVMPGTDGLEKMKDLMVRLRATPPTELDGMKVTAVCDYLPGERKTLGGATEKLSLSGSNVLCFELENGCKILVRPSGTEPKVKIYCLAKGQSKAAAGEALQRIITAGTKLAE